MLNALVTDAKAGAMPVVSMPSTLHPLRARCGRRRHRKPGSPFLGDRVQLGLFSVGDLVMVFGGILIDADATVSERAVHKLRSASISAMASSSSPDQSKA